MRVLASLALLFAGLFGRLDMTTVTTYQIITPDGVTFNLDGTTAGCGYRIFGLENIGMPPVRSYTHTVPGQSGVVLDDLLDDARTITVSHAATGDDIDDVFEEMNDVLANYRYNRTATLQPLKFRVTFGSKVADLYCYYAGMTISKVDNVHALWGMNLVAYDPYWYASTETSTALDPADTLAVHYVLGKVGGLWTAMSDPAATTFGSVICSAVDAAGDLYVGGDFTDWDGIAAADYIAKYDVSAGTWAAVAATPLNGVVTNIKIAANGDIYICGAFTNAGGAGTADYLAVLLSGGADWTSITPGGAIAAVAGLFALRITADGYLWIGGGAMTSVGGVAANAIAKYAIATGTWTAAAGLGAADIVLCIAQGQDGTIYAGGSFANASGDTDADNIAYWTGAAWAAVGGPMDNWCYTLAVGADGKLYAGGIFTTWDGVTVNYVGCWNGSVVSAMDSGTNNAVYCSHIDNYNNLYIGGTFSAAGGVATFDGVAKWNGNSWQAIPVGFPGVTRIETIATIGDDVFFGFRSDGTATVPGDASVTYSGNVAFPPTITILCGATARTLYSIRNETTGVEILANLYLSPGETITIDLGSPGEIPAGKSVTSNWATRPGGDNLLGKILSPTALTRFVLVPSPIATSGANLINCRMSGTGPTVTMKHYNRYDSLQAALD